MKESQSTKTDGKEEESIQTPESKKESSKGVEWSEISNQILSFTEEKEENGQKTQTKVQVFLDEAQKFLLELIFKHQVYSC